MTIVEVMYSQSTQKLIAQLKVSDPKIYYQSEGGAGIQVDSFVSKLAGDSGGQLCFQAGLYLRKNQDRHWLQGRAFNQKSGDFQDFAKAAVD